MNCCRCIVAVRDAPEIPVNAAITVYNGEALCSIHFRHTWESDQEFKNVQLPVHLSGDNIR